MPIDASIPLSGIAPKITSPAQLMSLRDLAAQTRMRESELDYLPKKRRMAEQQFETDQSNTLSLIEERMGKEARARSERLQELSKGANTAALNSYLITFGQQGDEKATMALRDALKAEIQRQWRDGSLASNGVTRQQYEDALAEAANATHVSVGRKVYTTEQAQEIAAYPAAGAQQPQPPQAPGMAMSQIGQPPASDPTMQGGAFNGPEGVDRDTLGTADAYNLLMNDANPYAEARGPNAGNAGIETAQTPGMSGAVSLQDVSRGAPWERLRTEADAMERRGGKVNYERAKDMRAEADRLEDNARAERQLEATIADRREKTESRLQGERFKKNDQENKLSDDFVKASKVYVDTRDAYTRIKSAITSDSPAGDLSLMFNYMKMLDPGSVVRESEFATVAATGSFGQRLQAAAERVISGKRLTKEQRQDFEAAAGKLYSGILRNHEKLEGQFKKRAEAAGVDVDDVVLDLRPAALDEWTEEDERRYQELKGARQ